MKNKLVRLLLLWIPVIILSPIARSQGNHLKVHIHLNGYKGNFYTRTKDPADSKQMILHWLYPQGKTLTIDLVAEDNVGNYNLFNGFSNFDFYKKDGNVLYVPNEGIKKFRKISPDEIEFTLKTALVKIRTNGLSVPYILSAFALIPGRTTTNDENVQRGNIKVRLIKGMSYAIKNQTYYDDKQCPLKDAMPDNPGFMGAECNNLQMSKKKVPGTGSALSDNFIFLLSGKGKITLLNIDKAASISKNGHVLKFKTVDVTLDPKSFSNSLKIEIYNDYKQPYKAFTERTQIRVIDGLLNYMRWIDKNSMIHNYFYAMKN